MIKDALVINVHIAAQQAQVWRDTQLVRSYLVSTGRKGIGQELNSEQTPLGKHEVCEKIGGEAAPNTIFRHRKPTGELYTPYLRKMQPDSDWIITRILRLRGLEPGKNQGGTVDTFTRCIYFHGAPDESAMGLPASRGCIRMHNWDIIELFNWAFVGTLVNILP